MKRLFRGVVILSFITVTCVIAYFLLVITSYSIHYTKLYENGNLAAGFS